MDDLEKLAAINQQKARAVLRSSGLREAWEAVGARVNPIGSLAMGLLLTHRDIDLHVYTETLEAAVGVRIMSDIGANPAVKHLEYRNLAATEEACLEWHVWYEYRGELWQIDLIQIRRGSRYDGYFEEVASRIAAALTPETRRAILELKYRTPETESIHGIEYYQAVLDGGVRTWPEFLAWRAAHPVNGIITWRP